MEPWHAPPPGRSPGTITPVIVVIPPDHADPLPGDVEPHPELAATIRPTAEMVTLAAAATGWLPHPEDRRFVPVVPA